MTLRVHHFTSLMTVLLVLAATDATAQELPVSPRLVVHVQVQGLRTDQLRVYSKIYGDKGIKRLWKEGRVYTHGQMPYIPVDRASAVATLMTGAVPAQHGIISEKWFDVETLHPIGAVDDTHYMGNYTDDTTSPHYLIAETYTDALKEQTQNTGLVYSVAPWRDVAVLAAGHVADGAYWIDDNSGNWCSTTYYPELPEWLADYNLSDGVGTRIKDIVWKPFLSFEDFHYQTSTYHKKPFKYPMRAYRESMVKRFMASPLVNDEVNKIVDKCLQYTRLGRDETPDVLMVGYTVGRDIDVSLTEQPMEQQDAYVRLDLSIQHLLGMIERHVGLNRTLVVLSGVAPQKKIHPALGRYHLPSGEFRVNRCAALLNLYLMAKYGDGKWVSGYHDQQIYLNHALIEKRQMQLDEVQLRAAHFLAEFSGVQQVYSSHQLLLGGWSPQTELFRAGFHVAHSGDLFIDILPGWKQVDEQDRVVQVVQHGTTYAPIILMGPNVKAQIIHVPVNMTQICPTICSSIHIRGPNAAASFPLH